MILRSLWGGVVALALPAQAPTLTETDFFSEMPVVLTVWRMAQPLQHSPRADQPVDVRGHVELYIGYTSDTLKDPSEAYHNMDAQSIPANEAPLWVRRTAAHSWQVGVSEASGYMSYCEFYWGIFRGRLPENKIPMCANGPLTFETPWTRELVN